MTAGEPGLEWIHSAREVDRPGWDRLAGDDGFYLCQGWLALQEGDEDSPRSYVVARGADGAISGALPVDRVDSESNDFYLLSAVLPPEVATPDERLMLLGGHGGYRSGFLLDPDLGVAERRATIDALVGEARRAAQGADRRAVFMYLDDTFLAEVATVSDVGTPLLSRHEATLQLPGQGWSDYLRSLPAGRRRTVPKEERRFAAADYSVAAGDLTPWLDQAGALLAQVQHRYGHDADPAGMSEMLHAQITDIDGHVAFVCTDGEDLLGFVLAFEFGDSLFLRAGGFDYDRVRGAGEYFNLAFYHPIRWAYEHGPRRLHFGIEALQAKSLRGAALSPLWTVPVGWNWSDEQQVRTANADRAASPLSW